MKKRNVFILGMLVMVLVFGVTVVGCDFGGNDDSDGTGGGGGGGGGGSGAGSTYSNPISVSIGYSSSHTISSSGEHWFKFTGTGDPIIFETTGSIVDTYMAIWDDYEYVNTSWTFPIIASNDNSGEGSNALCSLTTTSGKSYWIKVTARSSTSGTYTFVVKAPTSNLKTNPIMVSVNNSSTHTIFSSGTHWFTFTGTGDRVFFETDGNVVNTNFRIYIGDNANYSYSRRTGDKGINFITVLGTTYYINITGNSGSYTLNLRNGTGDGSSFYNAIEVVKGNSSSHTISSSGVQWFIYYGTGNPVTFKTTGNIVDTYMVIWDDYEYVDTSWTFPIIASNDNGGEGYNALCSITAISGKSYWIKITPRSSTSGTYTFVVE